MNPRYRRHLPLLLTGLAVLALAAVAIGLVIETAFGGNPNPGFSPPAPIPIATDIPTPPRHAAPSGPMQLLQGQDLVNGVYAGYPHSTRGAVSAAAEYLTQIGSTLDPAVISAALR